MDLSYKQIETMILSQIEDIDNDIVHVKGHVNYGYALYAELYKAKSMALQALVDLKNGYEN